MMNHLMAVSIVFFSSACLADNLSLEVQAKDLFVKGTFGFLPGGSLKISGSDTTGKPYDLEVISKLQKDDVVQFVLKLNHDGKKNSMSAITKKGTMASISSGAKGQAPDLKFDANWTE